MPLRYQKLLAAVRLVPYKTLAKAATVLFAARPLQRSPEPVAEGEALKCTAALPSERRSASLKR